MPSPADARPEATPAPSLRRRIACLLYESTLLFGVLMIAALMFSIIAGQRHALYLRGFAMAFLFAVLGLYFVYAWSRGGQTLAMQTWRIRLVRADGGPVGQSQALVRYLAGWIWLLPPLGLVAVNGVNDIGIGGTLAIIMGWVLGYALTALARPDRQFWHDAICGTRLIHWVPQRADGGGGDGRK
jgi:uncharacterized RDD family membrane protein YckC